MTDKLEFTDSQLEDARQLGECFGEKLSKEQCAEVLRKMKKIIKEDPEVLQSALQESGSNINNKME